MTGPFRIQPAMPVHAYRTFGISKPLATHWRPATCEEVQCEAFVNGWITRAQTDEQAAYIKRHSGRSFIETAKNVFQFKPGQTCFAAADHKVPLEREGIYVARGGDWRGNPTGERRVHARPADWVEEFAEHQDMLADRVRRG